jgi:hypothetical protein
VSVSVSDWRVANHLLAHGSDVFRGDKIDKLSLKGLDHVMAFSIVNGVIMMRLYYLRFKKSGSKVWCVLMKNLRC